MFIQQTPFGLKSLDAKDFADGKITEAEFNKITKGRRLINNGERLRFLNEDGSMDCVISINMFKDVIPKYIKTFSGQLAWLKSNGVC